MPSERIKFYQIGSFAAGNRLLPEDLRSVQSSGVRANTLTCGHRACQGAVRRSARATRSHLFRPQERPT